jgi:hypothetical protein
MGSPLPFLPLLTCRFEVKEVGRVLFVGDDWAEAHHDVEIVDEQGRRLVKRRLPEGLDGVSRLHALIAGAMPPGLG